MLNYAIDARVHLEFDGSLHKVPLTMAIAMAAKLLGYESVFSVKDEHGEVYCTYDGDRLYADTRVSTLIHEMGIALTEA
jgi:hypothetical protein